MGTVVLTSVGMAAPAVPAWGVRAAVHPLAVAVGGVARRNADAGEDAEVLALNGRPQRASKRRTGLRD
jgi:hypothetical protein